MKIITVTNQKGGVGKTELSKNLAVGLGNRGYRVLACDGDTQGNLTWQLRAKSSCEYEVSWAEIEQEFEKSKKTFIDGFALMQKEFSKSSERKEMADVLEFPGCVRDTIIRSKYGNVDLIPSSMKLINTDIKIRNDWTSKQYDRLYRALQILKDEYDYVIIDTPPITNMVTVNALYAASNASGAGNEVILPVKNNSGAWEGFVDTVSNMLAFCESTAIDIDIKIVFSMVNRTKNDMEAERVIRKMFPDNVFNTSIRYQSGPVVRSSFDKNAVILDKRAKVGREFDAVVDEILGQGGAGIWQD